MRWGRLCIEHVHSARTVRMQWTVFFFATRSTVTLFQASLCCGCKPIMGHANGFCRARIEPLFAQLWYWGIPRNIWRGCCTELHE